MTEDAPAAAPRRCLFPAGVQSAKLYHSTAEMDRDLQRCVEQGWQVIDLDVSGWDEDDRLHSDLAGALGFPSYYGRNLDALDDAMAGLAEGRYGFAATVPGGAIVLRHFDVFVNKNPDRAAILFEIMTAAAQRALRFGWPLGVFANSTDPSATRP